MGEVLLGVGLARGAGLDGDDDARLVEGVGVGVGSDVGVVLHGNDGEVIDVVRVREVNLLLALGLDGDAGDAQVNLTTGGNGRNDGVELQVLELELEAELVGERLGEVHVEAHVLVVLEVLERREVRRGAHGELAGREQLHVAGGGGAWSRSRQGP